MPSWWARNCIVGGCNNTTATPGISLFNFPKDSKIKNLWVAFVRQRRPQFREAGSHCRICSDHFADTVFDPRCRISRDVGGPAFRALLKKFAVLTIQQGSQRLTRHVTGCMRKKVGQSHCHEHNSLARPTRAGLVESEPCSIYLPNNQTLPKTMSKKN